MDEVTSVQARALSGLDAVYEEIKQKESNFKDAHTLPTKPLD
eukprot:CAMPEP_0203911410 /NCGR_PEP_ID=MMETSP0359-20131031/52578_1 /ASSEMBLY_ACC=CAM_ASM_000338 /TAXON_ID=268821 /ORGANISM="Scrippsiella Hangoei, Strain SHTV-5" /LENGTH=41 /DNA_ID= /DNA_START= /DNA_END= /DNA_ORIENTATION=